MNNHDTLTLPSHGRAPSDTDRGIDCTEFGFVGCGTIDLLKTPPEIGHRKEMGT